MNCVKTAFQTARSNDLITTFKPLNLKEMYYPGFKCTDCCIPFTAHIEVSTLSNGPSFAVLV